MKDINIQWQNGVPHIHPQDMDKLPSNVKIIDVRTKEEYEGELGHIQNSLLSTMGPDLEKYLEKASSEPIVFVCRSGNRSGQVTKYCHEALGKTETYNMTGGMLLWNELGLKKRVK